MDEIISKSEAKRKGLKHYYTGKPCKRGHLVMRLVSGSACTSCLSIARSKYISSGKHQAWLRRNQGKIKKRRISYSKKLQEAKALVGELVTRLMSYRTGVATSSALMDAWDTARPLVLEAPDSTLAREVFEMALDSIEEEASETITKATNWLEGK